MRSVRWGSIGKHVNLSDFKVMFLFRLLLRVVIVGTVFKGVLYLPSAPQIEHVEVELNFYHHGDPDKDL